MLPQFPQNSGCWGSQTLYKAVAWRPPYLHCCTLPHQENWASKPSIVLGNYLLQWLSATSPEKNVGAVDWPVHQKMEINLLVGADFFAHNRLAILYGTVDQLLIRKSTRSSRWKQPILFDETHWLFINVENVPTPPTQKNTWTNKIIFHLLFDCF